MGALLCPKVSRQASSPGHLSPVTSIFSPIPLAPNPPIPSTATSVSESSPANTAVAADTAGPALSKKAHSSLTSPLAPLHRLRLNLNK